MDRVASGRCTIDLAKAGIKLAASPIKVSFQELSYCVRERYILKNCTGYCLPGHTHYIMGATGAGKTSMLSAISGRLRLDRHQRLEGGRVMLNDQVELTAQNFGKYGGYVMQDDILFEFFTVHEALTFAARLKLDHMTHEQ